MWCVFACQYAGNAAATSPARGGGRLAASAPRSAITRLRSGSRPSPCIPPPRAGSAKGGGIPRPAHSVSVCAFLVRCGGAPPATARPSGVRRGIPSPDTARSAWGWIQPSCASQPSRRRLPRPAVRACSASCRRLRVLRFAPSKRKKFCGRREGSAFKGRPQIPSSHRIYPSSKGVSASAINQIEPLNTRNYAESLISVCFRAFRG